MSKISQSEFLALRQKYKAGGVTPQESERMRKRLRYSAAAYDADVATSRGWSVSTVPFDMSDLCYARPVEIPRRPAILPSLIDHAVRYSRRPPNASRGRGTPAAILSHSYELDRAAHVAHARAATCDVEFLPWSWYNPEGCLAVLYVRRLPNAAEDDAMTLAAFVKTAEQIGRAVGFKNLVGIPPDDRARDAVARLEAAGAIVRAPPGGLPRGVRGPAWTVGE